MPVLARSMLISALPTASKMPLPDQRLDLWCELQRHFSWPALPAIALVAVIVLGYLAGSF
jgi:hypothetical protein